MTRLSIECEVSNKNWLLSVLKISLHHRHASPLISITTVSETEVVILLIEMTMHRINLFAITNGFAEMP